MFGGRLLSCSCSANIWKKEEFRSNSHLQIRSFFHQLRYVSKLKLRSFWQISPTKTTNSRVGMIVPTNANWFKLNIPGRYFSSFPEAFRDDTDFMSYIDKFLPMT